ncbi:hypothetical protein Tco_0788882 [Tanacetum coccineum]
MPPRIMSSAEDNRLPAVDSPYYTHQDIFPSLIQRRRMRRTLPTILQTRRDDGGRRMRGGHPSILPTLTKEDLYKFVDMVDDAPRHPGCPISRELDYGITDEWDGLMEDARDDRSELRGRVDLLYSDRPIHHHLAVMVEREAWMAREAWDFLMDAADHQNNSVDLKALKLLKGLHTQKAEFQKGRIGTAEGPHSLRFTRGGLKMGTEEEGPQEPRGQGQSPTTPPPHVIQPGMVKIAILREAQREFLDLPRVVLRKMESGQNQGYVERLADNKRKAEDSAQNNQIQQANKRQNTGRAYAAGNVDRGQYEGPRPWCSKVKHITNYGPCASNATSATDLGHIKRDCPKLKNNNNRGNRDGNAKAPTKVYAVGNTGANPDNNVVTGCHVFLANITATKDEDKSKGKRLEDVPIVRNIFPEVFPEYLPHRVENEGISGATTRTYDQGLHKTNSTLGEASIPIRQEERRVLSDVYRLQRIEQIDGKEPLPTPKD